MSIIPGLPTPIRRSLQFAGSSMPMLKEVLTDDFMLIDTAHRGYMSDEAPVVSIVMPFSL